MAKIKAGEGPCPVCGERIVWRQNDAGTVSCFCQDCDFQGYAKNGTQAKKKIIEKFGGAVDEVPPGADPAPAPPGPPPGGAPQKKTGAFGVFGL